jgi:histidinol-phosphatase (PHP family)
LETKLFSSLHTHTVFCDGKDDVETMCRAAYDKGLAAIGFSAHAPMEKKTGLKTTWHMKDERLNAYIDEVNAARRRWEGKIAVYLGLELDYIKGLRCALDDDIQSLNLDYLISSVHYLIPPYGALFTVDGPPAEVETGVMEGFAGDGEAMVNAYWDAVTEMLALGGFDIIGHLDLVKKNNAANRFFNSESETWLRRVEETVRAIAAAAGGGGDFVVEVNTGGINRGYLSEPYPSPAIMRLLRQYKVPVMISADAHNARDIDGHYQTACQMLRDAGYTSHVIFGGRSNGKPVWREEPLK